MRQILYDIRGSFGSTFLMDWLNCTEGGTSDSLSGSDDGLIELYGGRYQ